MIDDLLARVKETEDEALADPAPVLRVEEAIVAYASRPRSRKKPWAAIAGGAVLAAALVLLSVLAGRELAPRPPLPRASIDYELLGGEPSVGGYVAAPSGASLHFSEGTEIDLLSGAEARVMALRPTGADLLIESGGLHASVTHTDESDWRFHAGPFAIVVIGTRFSATWAEDEGALEVAVEEGVVRVEGSCLDAPRTLRAGEAAALACPQALTEAELTPVEVVPVEVVPVEVAPVEVESPEAAIEPAREALTEAPRTEGRAPTEGEAATLLEDAQRAALAGDLFAAEQGLRAVRETARGSDEAALAAFLLGRLAFDEQHAYAAAAQWFATYLEERPSGRLAREAMGRELEARERGLDEEGARALAARYLERFPEGPHAERAARILGVASE